jgi:hypothetical protein
MERILTSTVFDLNAIYAMIQAIDLPLWMSLLC